MANILGTPNNDVLAGNPNNDVILGDAGDDILSGEAGDDQVYGNSNVQFFGLAANNTLISFSSANPSATTSVPISGVDGTLLGIDVRPANGLIYGISTTNAIYTIDPKSGVATFVSTLSQPFTATSISGFDFNPVADRLRLVGDNDQNFRINVDTGAVTVDGTLAYAAGDVNANDNPTITASAYTNSFDSAATTQLYNIDAAQDLLVLQNPPNNGTLVTVGSLGVDFGTVGGFDILSTSNGGNLVFAVSNSTLYSIDLVTGAATSLGTIGNGTLSLQGLVAAIGEAGSGSNTLNGGDGNDTLVGGINSDVVSGNAGNDVLDGGDGNDTIQADSGTDILRGREGDDLLLGGEGDDLMAGGNGNDTLRGATGSDLLDGSVGNDNLDGGDINDWILGGANNDRLQGGDGNDKLDGDAVLQFFALTDKNTIVSFDPNSPEQNTKVTISGVEGTLIGIDVRPADGKLYGLSTTNILYTIDPNTGVATVVSTLSQPFAAGTVSGFDFNPAADRLRLVGDNDQNFRINVDTGEVTVDGTLAYAPGDANQTVNPTVTAAAYTNSFAGTSTTQLYNIDAAQDLLVLQNPPNDGALSTIGSLGVDFDTTGGFDILSSANGVNRAVAVSDSVLYSIDLATGAASRLGQLGGVADTIIGLASTVVSDGAAGRDTLRGGKGNDSLYGGRVADTLIGDQGADTLVGGIGNDVLTGNQGADAFTFASDLAFKQARLGVDRITDFGRGNDRIVLSQTTFGALSLDQIDVVATNRVAKQSDGLIVYSRGSGNLYFNQNGAAAGFGEGRLFARLEGSPTLRVGDFEIVA